MTWDAKRRVYVDDDGRVMSAAQVRAEVSDYVEQQKSVIERDALKLLAGTITLAAFFFLMRSRIRAWHDVAGSIAYGGKARVNAERGARIAAKVSSELKYLKDFQEQASTSFAAARSLAISISEGLFVPSDEKTIIKKALVQALNQANPSTVETIARAVVEEINPAAVSSVLVDQAKAQELIGATIPTRSQMYADAAYSTYENNVAVRESESGMVGRRVCPEDDQSCEECVDAASTYFSDLSDIPEIGSLQCLNNCRCYVEYAEPTPGIQLNVESPQEVDAVQ